MVVLAALFRACRLCFTQVILEQVTVQEAILVQTPLVFPPLTRAWARLLFSQLLLARPIKEED